MANEIEKLIPPNISDTGKIDDDSGLRLFRGMMTPWDQIKSFKETYQFAVRHSALFAVGWINALKIIEPDYEKRTTAMSSVWAEELKVMWSPEDALGVVSLYEERFEIPPFMKNSMYRTANYCDKGDEMMLMAGHIWYASNDRFEKEIHVCDYDICGPEVCDVSLGGGQYFCQGLAGVPLNPYDSERKGCGDAYCHVCQETKRKYGEHPNDGYEWENWGPPKSGMRENGAPRKKEIEHLTTGIYTAPSGATWTTGEMYKDYTTGYPMAYSFQAVGGMRAILQGDEKAKAQAEYIVDIMFDTAGKLMFGELNTRKAARDWLGVPESVDDGRVMGGYISMIFQARNLTWKFNEFTEERTVIECDKLSLEMYGQYPEYTPAYVSYFNGMVKTLVNAEWIVRLDETAPEGIARFVIEKAVYGFRRQKPGYTFEKKGE